MVMVVVMVVRMVVMVVVVMPAAASPVVMPVPVAVVVGVVMVMVPIVLMGVGVLPLKPRRSASAYRAHHSTSISLIRISSPPCGSSFPPPHRGQGSNRSASSTTSAQS